VTTGCDPVLIPKGLSAFANRKELILAYHSCDGRNAEMAQLSATRPSNLTVLNSPDAAVGPRSWMLSLLRASGYEGAAFALRNRDGRKGGEPNRAPGVRFKWTAETAP
jgi:hypothetical protein